MKWFTWIIFIHDCMRYTKIGCNNNSTDSPNVMVNYHCHSEKRVITPEFPYMLTIMGTFSAKLLVRLSCK